MSSADPRSVLIAPSVLAADFARLAEEVRVVEGAGADLLHLDVMDGHFVPNISMGVPVVEALSGCTDLLLDTHLMISDPGRYAAAFVEAGSGSITFHIEVVPQPRDLIARVRDLGVKVGVALNPGTPAEAILDIIGEVDIVLVMTVWPGFGGQAFIDECLDKVGVIAEHLRPGQWLEVDGGVNLETGLRAVRVGANVLVAGTSIFRAPSPSAALVELKQAALRAAREIELRTGTRA